jgi:hypothetical protein
MQGSHFNARTPAAMGYDAAAFAANPAFWVIASTHAVLTIVNSPAETAANRAHARGGPTARI